MNNPILTVDGYSIKCPSSYSYKLQDISSSLAGRTEDITMHKERIGQVVGLNLSWVNIKTTEATSLLQRFNPEYFSVRYFDLLLGDYTTATFYVGDREAPLYSAALDVWTLSFNIIKREGT